MLSILPLQMQAESANIQSRNQAENESRIQDLNKQVADYQDQIARSQAEVSLYFEILYISIVLLDKTMTELHTV